MYDFTCMSYLTVYFSKQSVEQLFPFGGGAMEKIVFSVHNASIRWNEYVLLLRIVVAADIKQFWGTIIYAKKIELWSHSCYKHKQTKTPQAGLLEVMVSYPEYNDGIIGMRLCPTSARYFHLI